AGAGGTAGAEVCPREAEVPPPQRAAAPRRCRAAARHVQNHPPRTATRRRTAELVIVGNRDATARIHCRRTASLAPDPQSSQLAGVETAGTRRRGIRVEGAPVRDRIKLVVINYYAGPIAVLDDDNMVKPIRDVLIGLVYV